MILMYKLIISGVVCAVGAGATYLAHRLPKGTPAQEVAQKVEDTIEKVVEKRSAARVQPPVVEPQENKIAE